MLFQRRQKRQPTQKPAELSFDRSPEPAEPEGPAPRAEETAAEPPAAAPQPTTEAFQQLLPLPESTRSRTTAEKSPRRSRRAAQDAEQSPFSVFVGQVYDGPLDLLLDLIRKQDIDIYDIPIAKITAQFLAYVDQLRASDMDVAGEFIYTAALLIHIKSKMLLPRAPVGPGRLGRGSAPRAGRAAARARTLQERRADAA